MAEFCKLSRNDELYDNIILHNYYNASTAWQEIDSNGLPTDCKKRYSKTKTVKA